MFDYLISDSEGNNKFYDFRVTRKGIILTYSNNYLSYFSILANNIVSDYITSEVYIENITDEIFVEIVTKIKEKTFITLYDVKDILSYHKCVPDMKESKEKEWDIVSYMKWIVIKQDLSPTEEEE